MSGELTHIKCYRRLSAYTIDCADIATGWTEQRTVWGRSETDIRKQLRDIEQSLTIELLDQANLI